MSKRQWDPISHSIGFWCLYSCLSACDTIADAEIILFVWYSAQSFMCHVKWTVAEIFVYSGTQIYLNTLYLRRKMCLYLLRFVCHAITVAEIIQFARNLVQMFIHYAKLAASFYYVDVHCPNSVYTGIYKSISIRYCLWWEIL